MKKISMYLFIVIGSIVFTGCAANYDNVNPNPGEVKYLEKGNNTLKALYKKQGYIEGEAAGFQKGLEYAKATFAELMNDIRAKQFSIYLSKERFIEAGPIYINPDTGEIELGKMEIRKPYTIADIFNIYGAEIPIKSNAMIKKELSNINDEIEEVQSSISPNIIIKDEKRHIVTSNNINGFIRKMYNTTSNVDILTKFDYKFGVIDDKLIIKFDDNKSADDFCNNFGCIK